MDHRVLHLTEVHTWDSHIWISMDRNST